tara:strand:- start:78 stop:2318 length:2241 start_codon:yes stop_codon:yes gene_type:complete
MANKYSKYSLTPYVSQYVDPGTVQVSQLLRQRYDQNKQKADLVERSLSNIQVGAGDLHIKTKAVNDINTKMAETVRVGDYENAGSVVDGIAQDFATNEGLQLASQSYANRQEEIKTARELEMKTGRKILDFNVVKDPETGEIIGHAFDAHQSFYQADDGSMVRNVYQGGTELMLDYDAKKQQMLQGIAKEGSSFKLGDADSDIAGLLERWTGVGQTKANKVANALLEEYLNTAEGLQEYKKLTELDGLTGEEATAAIVQSMRDVASKQVGMVPSYMQAPEKSGAYNPFDNGDVMILPGESAVDAGMSNFDQVETKYAEALNALKNAKTDDEKAAAKRQLANITSKRKSMFDNSMKNAPENVANAYSLMQDVFKGKNAKYAAIEPLLMELVADQSLLGGGRAFGGDVEYDRPGYYGGLVKFEGVSTDFRSVRSLFLGPNGEKTNLRNQLTGGLDNINAMFGTNYTEKDLENIHAVAEQYYDIFKNKGGDDLYKHHVDNAAIKTSDRIAFAASGSSKLNAVNNTLKSQLTTQSFNFISTDGDLMSEKEANKLIKELGDEATSTVFAGLTMPDMFTGTQGSMAINYAGKLYNVVPKDVSYAAQHMSVLNTIAREMGIADQYNNSEKLYNASIHGELTVRDINDLKVNQQLQPLTMYIGVDKAIEIGNDPGGFDIMSLDSRVRPLARVTIENLINIENNLLSLVGTQMGISNLTEMRNISNDESHSRHSEYKQVLSAFVNQTYNPETMGI